VVRCVVPLVLAAALAAGCLLPPDDADQIRTLVRDRAAALERGDRAALYRLHDIDYRAVCPFERFASLPLPAPERVVAVRAIEMRGVRGSAIVDVERAGAVQSERREFVKDAGRWYLYENAASCLTGRNVHGPRSHVGGIARWAWDRGPWTRVWMT
jgi:hypothetical protein